MASDTAHRESRELLAATFALAKNALVFDDKNAALLHACDRMAKAANDLRARSNGMAALRLLSDGAYINEQLARFDGTAHEHGEYLCTVWRSVGVGEIAAVGETAREDWLELTRELMRCIRGESAAVRLPGSRALEIASLEDVSREQEKDASVGARAARAYSVATLAMAHALDDLHHGRTLRIVELKRPLLELIDAAPECRALLLALVLAAHNKGTLAQQLINTATLVICLADQLALDRDVRSELALHACLYDLGRAATHVGGAAHVETRELEYATEAVCALLRSSPAPRVELGRVVVANEVRLWANSDPGADYPYGPSAAARLVAAASAYDLMTTPTPRRPALLPDQALRVIMAEAGRRYDDVAVRVLIDMLGAFPVGSTVLLSSGQVAIVLRASTSDDGWARPLVKIVCEPAGPAFDGPLLDLSRDADARVEIERCIAPESRGINAAGFLMG